MDSFNIIKRKEIYKGFVDIYIDNFQYKDTLLERINIETPDAASIVVLDEQNNIYLVKQLRYAVKQEILEIPAGIIDKGETPEQAAIREAEEELGYTVKNVSYLTDFYAMPGLSNHKVYIFLGYLDKATKQNLDEGEIIEVVKLPLADFFKLSIKDAKTLIAKLILQQKFNSI